MELGTARDRTLAGLAKELDNLEGWAADKAEAAAKKVFSIPHAYGVSMRDLYQLFRDGVIDDAISGGAFISHGGRTFVSPWRFLPKDGGRAGDRSATHVGRVQTMALIRRFMQRAAKEFPGGVVLNDSGFCVEEPFVEFVKTHRAMGSSHDDMVKAWAAMQSITG
jgi:hypothetical protein